MAKAQTESLCLKSKLSVRDDAISERLVNARLSAEPLEDFPNGGHQALQAGLSKLIGQLPGVSLLQDFRQLALHCNNLLWMGINDVVRLAGIVRQVIQFKR